MDVLYSLIHWFEDESNMIDSIFGNVDFGKFKFWSFINHSVTSPMFKSSFRFFWFENFSMGISPPIFPHYLLPAMFKFKNSFFCFRSPSESNNSFRKGFWFSHFFILNNANWILHLALTGYCWPLDYGHLMKRGTVMLVTSLCWWLYDGDWIQMLVAESLCWRLFFVMLVIFSMY